MRFGTETEPHILTDTVRIDTASPLKLQILKQMFKERRQSAKACQFRQECLTLHADGLLTQELAVAYIIELGEISPDPTK